MNPDNHFLQPVWPAPSTIHAVTTLRTGGVSAGEFASFNLGAHVNDDPAAVMQNRALLKARLQLPSEPVWLEQIHSNIALEATAATSGAQADASYSCQPDTVCLVMTADCLPLLVCDTEGKQIAAIHAGWRGLLAGVIRNTISSLHKADFMVWLGPAIGPNAFEVGDEVRQAFAARSSQFVRAFRPQAEQKWLVDIYQLARIELAMLGIEKVYGGEFCTFTQQDKFFSYRRDQQTGRMATLIWRDRF